MQTINSIRIDKLLTTLNNAGKIFRISFTGGEPFLIPNIVEACSAITKKHFVSFNTNLVLPSVREFADRISPERVLFIHASLHISELIRLNLVDTFTDNFLLLKEKGFSIFAEAVADAELNENEIQLVKASLERKNIQFDFGPFIGMKNGKNYPADYTDDELKFFDLERSSFTMFNQKGSLCNAGYNAAVVYPGGNVHSCFQVKKKLGNIYTEINFEEKESTCPAECCDCPLNYYDPYLFERAGLKDSSS